MSVHCRYWVDVFSRRAKATAAIWALGAYQLWLFRLLFASRVNRSSHAITHPPTAPIYSTPITSFLQHSYGDTIFISMPSFYCPNSPPICFFFYYHRVVVYSSRFLVFHWVIVDCIFIW